MGDVYSAAKGYERLLNKEYYFILGKNRKQVEIRLLFSKNEFYHLSGLHKLIDVEALNSQNSKKVFDSILDRTITNELCQHSINYDQIDERLLLIEKLEEVLDSNKTVFKFNNHANKFSVIEADYILKNSNETNNIYIYISKEKKSSDIYFCRSAFPRDRALSDYTQGHTSYTLLYKEKTDLVTGEKNILYTAHGFKNNYELMHT